MAAGGFKTFVAGEILTSADTNDFLMQGVLVFEDATARDAAITSPVEGQFAFLKDEDLLTFHNGTDFVPFESGLTYASISTAKTGSFTDGGIDFEFFDFTANGSLVITEDGLLDILVVGGGGGSGNDSNREGAGGAGAVRFGTFPVTAGTVSVTVGAAGAEAAFVGGAGSPTSFGSVLFAGGGGGGVSINGTAIRNKNGAGGGGSDGGGAFFGAVRSNPGGGARGTQGGGANQFTGIVLNFDGTSREYGIGGHSGSTSPANSGSGGTGGGAAAPQAATNGRVIVKVRV